MIEGEGGFYELVGKGLSAKACFVLPRNNSFGNCASAEGAELAHSLFKCPLGEHCLTARDPLCPSMVLILSNIERNSR